MASRWASTTRLPPAPGEYGFVQGPSTVSGGGASSAPIRMVLLLEDRLTDWHSRLSARERAMLNGAAELEAYLRERE
ncbi:hypothetical protein GCM10010361_13120 [Streptomyces olivaceiscleroticus]|uniref:Uncharacterized protein n=1 Tax=Streptomyces olivaceiscleroticus TaxID=68245 RepID=A0ABN0ZLA3_9ACTN